MKRSRTRDATGLGQVSESVIYPHVFENADREVGGVLVGRSAGGGGLPLVTGAIEAIKADEQRANLTFTQDAWEHVHTVLEQQYPEDEQIVGWYHSHPGFGIFLSQHDLFIHHNFFSGTSQIAVVVDPLAGTEGTFAWRGDELVQLYERETPPPWTGLEPDRPRPSARTPLAERPPAYPLNAIAGAAVLGVIVGLVLWVGVIRPGGSTDAAERTPTATAPATATPRSQSRQAPKADTTPRTTTSKGTPSVTTQTAPATTSPAPAPTPQDGTND